VLVGSSLTHCPAWGRTRTLLIQNLGWANHNQSTVGFPRGTGVGAGSFAFMSSFAGSNTPPKHTPGEGENLSGEFHIRGDSYFSIKIEHCRTLFYLSPCSTLVKRPATDRDKALAKRSIDIERKVSFTALNFSHICPVEPGLRQRSFLANSQLLLVNV